MEKKAFIDRIYPQAVRVTAGTGLFPDTLAAQAAHESNYGKSRLAKPDINNFFGIKARKTWPGRVASFSTNEEENGKLVKYQGTGLVYENYATAIADKANPITFFRAYDSEAQGLKNWVQFLQANKRYEKAGVFSAQTPAEQFEALKRAGYATDSAYTSKLNRILAEIKKISPGQIRAAGSIILPALLFGLYLILKK